MVLLLFDIHNTTITGNTGKYICLSSLLVIHLWKEKFAAVLSICPLLFNAVQCHDNVCPGPLVMIGYCARNICIVFTATSLSIVISFHWILLCFQWHGRKSYKPNGLMTWTEWVYSSITVMFFQIIIIHSNIYILSLMQCVYNCLFTSICYAVCHVHTDLSWSCRKIGVTQSFN
jgi:hypothetical protein